MGIVKAIASAIGGSLADQWLEVIEPYDMSDRTVFTSGMKVRKNDKHNSNTKATQDLITNGSVIHVYPNQFMFIVDGGKIVDYTAEEGYYIVDNKAAPSIFNGKLKDSVKESFGRIKFGGVASTSQKIYYVNLQEIKGIKFGTYNPINYYDEFYRAELFLCAHGNYSIKITNPIHFYTEVVPKNKNKVNIEEINEQYKSEFLTALQSSINQMSLEGKRISHVLSKTNDLCKFMADTLDEDWNDLRGMEILSVGIASLTYDDNSIELINMRNKGAMLSDPLIREGYIQGSIARGMEAAGSNEAGAMAGFMGLNMASGGGGGFVGAASEVNMKQIEKEEAKQSNQWKCECGFLNSGSFCKECGKQKSGTVVYRCDKCGMILSNTDKFCDKCGDAVDVRDILNN